MAKNLAALLPKLKPLEQVWIFEVVLNNKKKLGYGPRNDFDIGHILFLDAAHVAKEVGAYYRSQKSINLELHHKFPSLVRKLENYVKDNC